MSDHKNADVGQNKPPDEEEAPQILRLNPVKLWAVVGFIIALVLAFHFLVGDALETRIQAFIVNAGPWTVLVFLTLMVAHNFVPIPAEMIAMSAGAVLGPLAGISTIWVGAMLGAVVAFWISRRFGRKVVVRFINPKYLSRLDTVAAHKSGFGLLLLRFVPIVSFNLLNYAAGLTSVSWFTYLWTTALGIIPILVLSVFAGANLAHFEPAFVLLALLVLGLVVLFVRKCLTKCLK